MNSPHPREVIRAGAEILNAVLAQRGFEFAPGEEGQGSGGTFAQGRFTKGNRSIEFSFRYGLGEVSYRIGEKSISHENYLKYSGNWQSRKYSDFSSIPEESFLALAQDIESYLSDFTEGNGNIFLSLVAEYEKNPSKFKGFAALHRQ